MGPTSAATIGVIAQSTCAYQAIDDPGNGITALRSQLKDASRKFAGSLTPWSRLPVLNWKALSSRRYLFDVGNPAPAAAKAGAISGLRALRTHVSFVSRNNSTSASDRQPAAVEGKRHLLRLNGWQIEG